MFAVAINDSHDDNARVRQAVRVAALFSGASVTTVGVSNDLEAAGNLVDVLDASLGEKGVVLVNVAPRSGSSKEWGNGSPFCFFFVGNTIVVSTFEGETLSLVKKLGLVEIVHLMEVEAVLRVVERRGLIRDSLVREISNSQFRSFEFIPRVAHWLVQGIHLPARQVSLECVLQQNNVIWLVDCFGNAKTTILSQDIGFEEGKIIHTAFGALSCWNRLADVPDGETALIVGSSGFGNKRFLEIVVQGESAAQRLGIRVGDQVI